MTSFLTESGRILGGGRGGGLNRIIMVTLACETDVKKGRSYAAVIP